MKKFSLTKNKKDYFGTTLYQIKAEMSFGDVVKGELGGWVEKKENLDEDGNAWVSGNALVYGNELIYTGEAKFGDSEDEEVANAIKL
jgi:hypothetical protein